MPRLATITEAAAETGLTYNCLRQWCLTGQIIYIRVGKKILINMNKLEDFLNGELHTAEEIDANG